MRMRCLKCSGVESKPDLKVEDVNVYTEWVPAGGDYIKCSVCGDTALHMKLGPQAQSSPEGR